MVPIVPAKLRAQEVLLPSVIILAARHKVYFCFDLNKRILVKDCFLTMLTVNAQYLERMWLGSSESSQAQSVELEAFTRFSPPYSSFLHFCNYCAFQGEIRQEEGC